MCLGLVCQVAAVLDGDVALVRTGARDVRVSLLTLDEPVAPGDWLMVHAGFALARLTEQQAVEALAMREPTAEDAR
ncbi:MAG TPA: HypC/HybG/HupF family hydrogenase formation chaperone [Actinomycetes bacterium]|jgi:hydrogenase expression/formation protein HypC